MNTKLLKLLSKDSRTSTADIAVMLGMEEKDVIAEIAQMEKEGLIRGYKAVIDWDKLDNAYVSAIIELKVTPKAGLGFEDKEAESIDGEFKANGFMQNELKHTRGVLSMARTSDPNSASSQFFVMHKDAPHLDAQYAGFGKVIEGEEVIDKIASVPTGRMGWFSDVPKTPVVIEKMEIIER